MKVGPLTSNRSTALQYCASVRRAHECELWKATTNMSRNIKMEANKTKHCKTIFMDFLNCVKETSCVREEGKALRECSAAKDLPEVCQTKRMRFVRCKRGLVRHGLGLRRCWECG